MTLLVAAKIPTRHLNPYRRPIKFVEKGILMVADTRLSLFRGKEFDDAFDDSRKLWEIADCALAGFCGPYLVAEPAIVAAHFNLMKRSHRPWKLVVKMMENLLKFFHQDAKKNIGQIDPTVVFLGVKTGKSSFRLFEIHSGRGVKRAERDGVIVEGTGKEEFKRRFPGEVDDRSKQWSEQLSGYKIVEIDGKVCCVPSGADEKYEVNLVALSSVISAVVDDIVVSRQVRTVGGSMQIIKFTEGGFERIGNYVRSTQGQWREATLPGLRSYSEIGMKAYCIPLVDDDGNVTNRELALE